MIARDVVAGDRIVLEDCVSIVTVSRIKPIAGVAATADTPEILPSVIIYWQHHGLECYNVYRTTDEIGVAP